MGLNGAMQRKVVLTGLQPTAALQLGNYLGALQNWVSLQREEYECFFFLSDFHAISVPQASQQLRDNTLDCIALYLACGIDPQRSHVFIQSQVRGHTELAWVLGCLASLGQLERMTQFKDKSRRQKTGFTGAGLLYYPILMAADILLYHAQLVPVGDDQRQHLELTRDLAEKFNGTYGTLFHLPEALIPNFQGRIMSLQNPMVKMSKSDPNPLATIFLTDSPDQILKKFRAAVTDSAAEIRCDVRKPGIRNLLHIFHGISGESIEALEIRYASSGYGKFKTDLAEAVIEHFTPIREAYFSLREDRAMLHAVGENGRRFAQQRADSTVRDVYDRVGFMETFHEAPSFFEKN